MNAIPILPKPEYKVDAALYFLDGQYLFKIFTGKTSAKFVTAKDVAAAFEGKEEDTGWLAPGVVRCGHNAGGDWYVYSTPPQTTLINLDDGGGISTLQIPLPRLVLLAIGGNYYLWALADKAFSPDSMAYKTPYPNVYEDGKICWGSNPVPKISLEKAREPWKLFFEAPFNGHLVNGKSQEHTHDVRRALRGLADRNARRYPAGDLVPERSPIGQLVKMRVGQ